MYSKSDNMVMACDNPDKIFEEVSHSLLSRYQISLETQMTERGFIFDGVDLLYYKYNKIYLKRCGSDIDSPDQIRKKKAKINSKNDGDDDKCFQYAATIALNFDEI